VSYEGHAAGPHYVANGSGSNFLCLHETPQWKNYLDGVSSFSGLIYGVGYELGAQNNVFSYSNNGGNSLGNLPAPCAACYVGGRSTVLMIPARTLCPDGWTKEYSGYIAAEHRGYTRASYICLDEAPEVAAGGFASDQAVIYPVEVYCGSLPCSVYITGRELTCVVCSK